SAAGGPMFTIALHFYDEAGTRVGDANAFAFAGLDDWTPAVCRGEAPAGTSTMTVGIHTHGVGVFEVREMSLKRLPNSPQPPGPDEPVIITVTDDVVTPAVL